MMRKKLLSVVAGVLALSATGVAQEQGNWRAVSQTAKSITGGVIFVNDSLWINYSAIPFAQIRALTPAELGAVFSAEADGTGKGNLYRMNIPASKKLLHKNTLCGTEDTEWMVTYVNGRDLQIAFFSGAKVPPLTVEGIANTTNLCGTFSYTR